MRNDCSNVTYNTLLELYLHDASVAITDKDFKVISPGGKVSQRTCNLYLYTNQLQVC